MPEPSPLLSSRIRGAVRGWGAESGLGVTGDTLDHFLSDVKIFLLKRGRVKNNPSPPSPVTPPPTPHLGIVYTDLVTRRRKPRPAKRDPVLTVRIPEKELAALRRQATKEGVSVSQLVRELLGLRKGLRREPK